MFRFLSIKSSFNSARKKILPTILLRPARTACGGTWAARRPGTDGRHSLEKGLRPDCCLVKKDRRAAHLTARLGTARHGTARYMPALYIGNRVGHRKPLSLLEKKKLAWQHHGLQSMMLPRLGVSKKFQWFSLFDKRLLFHQTCRNIYDFQKTKRCTRLPNHYY